MLIAGRRSTACHALRRDQDHEPDDQRIGPRPAEAKSAAHERTGHRQPKDDENGEHPRQPTPGPFLQRRLAGPEGAGRHERGQEHERQSAQVLANARRVAAAILDVIFSRPAC